MFKGNFPGAALTVLVFLSLAVFADAALAANTGSSILPAANPLQQIRDFFTGSFAWTVSLIAIVISGSVLAFGGSDLGGAAKSLIFLALILSMVVFANNWVSSMFSGALIP